MDWLVANALHALGAGLLLFLLASGLTIAFGLMGVLSFAHGAFYAAGAYVGWQIAAWLRPWLGELAAFVMALAAAPVLVAGLGAAVDRYLLQPLRPRGHLPELLLTCGLSYLAVETFALIWGHGALEPYAPIAWADQALVLGEVRLPLLRLLAISIASTIVAVLAFVMLRTRLGLILRAAIDQPRMIGAMGIALPRVQTWTFAASCGLAALAGVLGGNLGVIEPSMVHSSMALAFVIIIIGGLGSLRGAFLASLIVGGLLVFGAASSWSWAHVAMSRWAGALPYAAMVVVLALRPEGLLGRRA